jgi:hypothetical protein
VLASCTYHIYRPQFTKSRMIGSITEWKGSLDEEKACH